MLNRWTGMGRLTRDPELKHTANGIAVTSITLAVDRDFKTSSGETIADFIDIVCWRNTAEFVSKYFRKGMRTVVDGTLQVRSWKDNNGNNRKAVEVVAEHVYFADNKRTSGNDEQSSQPAKDPLGQDFRDLGDMDDGELPF